MKKIAITSIFANVTYNDTNHRGLEAMFIKELMETKGAEVDIVCYKNRNVKDLDFYRDYTETDFSEYGAVIIQLSTPNFFGGQIGEHTEKICNDLAKYAGKVYFMLSDPRIPPMNYAKILSERFDKCTDSIEAWDKIIETATYLFAGKSVEQFIGWQPKNWQHVDWFIYIFKKLYEKRGIADPDANFEKTHDLVYYGDRRGTFREQQLRKYFPKDTKNLLIGYKSDKVPGEFIKKLKHDELMEQLNHVKVSLVTGDEEHMNNVVTFRFYETLASNCLAAIQIEYDPEKKLIQDPELRDLLYVSSQEDVKRLIDAYSPELVKKQQAELKRLFNV
jgi:hypothetical protein